MSTFVNILHTNFTQQRTSFTTMPPYEGIGIPQNVVLPLFTSRSNRYSLEELLDIFHCVLLGIEYRSSVRKFDEKMYYELSSFLKWTVDSLLTCVSKIEANAGIEMYKECYTIHRLELILETCFIIVTSHEPLSNFIDHLLEKLIVLYFSFLSLLYSDKKGINVTLVNHIRHSESTLNILFASFSRIIITFKGIGVNRSSLRLLEKTVLVLTTWLRSSRYSSLPVNFSIKFWSLLLDFYKIITENKSSKYILSLNTLFLDYFKFGVMMGILKADVNRETEFIVSMREVKTVLCMLHTLVSMYCDPRSEAVSSSFVGTYFANIFVILHATIQSNAFSAQHSILVGSILHVINICLLSQLKVTDSKPVWKKFCRLLELLCSRRNMFKSVLVNIVVCNTNFVTNETGKICPVIKNCIQLVVNTLTSFELRKAHTFLTSPGREWLNELESLSNHHLL